MSQRSRSASSKQRRDVKQRPLELGEKVVVNLQEGGYLYGTVRFEGPTHFSEGDWLGVELEQPKGKNNGSVQGVSYFACNEDHGVFVRPANATRLNEAKVTTRLQGSIFEAASRSNNERGQRLMAEADHNPNVIHDTHWFKKVADDMKVDVQNILQAVSKDIGQGQAGLLQSIGGEMRSSIQAAVESILTELRQQFVHLRHLKEELLPRFNTLAQELQELKEQTKPFKRMCVGAKVEENPEATFDSPSGMFGEFSLEKANGRETEFIQPFFMSPAAQRSTSPAAQRSTSPAAQRSTSPAAQRSTSPAAQRSTSPAAQRSHPGQMREDRKGDVMRPTVEQRAGVQGKGDTMSPAVEQKNDLQENSLSSSISLADYLPRSQVRSFEQHEKTPTMLELEQRIEQLSADKVTEESMLATYASILPQDSLGLYTSWMRQTSVDEIAEALAPLNWKMRKKLKEELDRPAIKENGSAEAAPYRREPPAPSMADLIASLGGELAINRFRSRSTRLAFQVQSDFSSAQRELPTIYHSLGSSNILSEASFIQEEFDDLMTRLVDSLKKDTSVAELIRREGDLVYLRSPSKSLKSVAAAANIYHASDSQILQDCICGTIQLKDDVRLSTLTKESRLEKAYRILERIVELEEQVFSTRAMITRFVDRYQDPVEDCREWVFFITIAGVSCELKVNLAQILRCVTESQSKESIDSLKSRLLQACATGDIQIAVWLLNLAKATQRLSIVEARDRYGQTVLHYAARLGQREVVSELLQMQADIFASDQNGFLALHHAIVIGHIEITQELVFRMESKKDVLVGLTFWAKVGLQRTWCLSRSQRWNMPVGAAADDLSLRIEKLAAACFRKKALQLRAVVSSGEVRLMKSWPYPVKTDFAAQPIAFHPHAPFGCTWLDHAVLSGSMKMVQCLRDLSDGFELQLSPFGPHADVQAAACGYARRNDLACLYALLRAVEITKQDVALANVLSAAIEGNAMETITSLVQQQGTKLSAEQAKVAGEHLIVAVGKSQDRTVSALIEAGVPATYVHEASRSSVLHVAVAAGDERLCRLLVSHFADVNFLGGSGISTPATLATCKGEKHMIKMLVELRADLNLKGEESRGSPLGECCVSNMPDMIEFMKPLGLATSGEHVEKLVTMAQEAGFVDVVKAIRNVSEA